jgi:hypothetical protein
MTCQHSRALVLYRSPTRRSLLLSAPTAHPRRPCRRTRRPQRELCEIIYAPCDRGASEHLRHVGDGGAGVDPRQCSTCWCWRRAHSGGSIIGFGFCGMKVKVQILFSQQLLVISCFVMP